ncbi:MAG: hypothetical protein IPK76_05530 [Lewinellaceae bacterium]|nr:hypothetical protein [Lewinellaceae bacterium]
MKEFLTKTREFVVHLFSAFGLLWLLVEISVFFKQDALAAKVREFWWLFGIIGLAYAIYKSMPKWEYECKVPNRDAIVFLRNQDIFKIKGSLIVPVNNCFKINQDGNLLTSNSILSQVVKTYFDSNPANLQNDINNKLSGNFYKDYKIDNREYKIGTVVPIKVNKTKFYFLANTKLNAQNKSNCDDEMIETSLNELWVYLSDCASKRTL